MRIHVGFESRTQNAVTVCFSVGKFLDPDHIEVCTTMGSTLDVALRMFLLHSNNSKAVKEPTEPGAWIDIDGDELDIKFLKASSRIKAARHKIWNEVIQMLAAKKSRKNVLKFLDPFNVAEGLKPVVKK